MTQMEIHSPARVAPNGYKVDVSRGQSISRVSSEWFNRPADERYLSLTELANTARDRTDRSRTRVVESALIHVEAKVKTRRKPGVQRSRQPGLARETPARKRARVRLADIGKDLRQFRR